MFGYISHRTRITPLAALTCWMLMCFTDLVLAQAQSEQDNIITIGTVSGQGMAGYGSFSRY